ncbi:transmembrane protein 184C [Culicoides brevitarsis]|uniref:transmembrane protein 184C n=1 Tax=Culicoides brevitarsis TaxID=469753 RepID=UPI00307BEA93
MCTSNFYSRYRRFMRPLLILIYLLLLILVVPYLIVNSVKDGFKSKDQLVLISGLFVILALPISFWHISQHIVHFTKPALQKHIIRILWMVPIYALNAWFGLLWPAHSIYMDSVRECYEAYVIYNFMKYLLNYLNLQMDLVANLEDKPQVKHFFPLCCLPTWEMGREFVHNCKHGILQYAVVRPITTSIAFICEMNDVYGEGQFKFNVAYIYILFINNISQTLAMYCLVLFYKANRQELSPMKPLPKFLCIKAVIFFSFFQGVLIEFLVYFGFISNVFGEDDFDKTDPHLLSTKLQNFLICIEMFLAAVAHHYSFPHKPFHINAPNYDNTTNRGFLNALKTMLDISDVRDDIGEHIGVVGSSFARRLQGRSNYYHVPRGRVGGEREYLITDQLNYQSSSSTTGAKHANRYGAMNIVKPPPKREDDGFVQANLFSVNYPLSTQSSMTQSSSSRTETENTTTGGGGNSSTQNIKKSDSSNSDWIAGGGGGIVEQQPNDFIEVNVRGREQTHINYKYEGDKKT